MKKALSGVVNVLKMKARHPGGNPIKPTLMKHIALLTLVAAAFGLGACAKDTKSASPSSQPVSKNVKGFKK